MKEAFHLSLKKKSTCSFERHCDNGNNLSRISVYRYKTILYRTDLKIKFATKLRGLVYQTIFHNIINVHSKIDWRDRIQKESIKEAAWNPVKQRFAGKRERKEGENEIGDISKTCHSLLFNANKLTEHPVLFGACTSYCAHVVEAAFNLSDKHEGLP